MLVFGFGEVCRLKRDPPFLSRNWNDCAKSKSFVSTGVYDGVAFRQQLEKGGRDW
jgi:hypothetical protein